MGNNDIEWDSAAEEMLEEVPSFIRSIARKKGEEAAKELGETRVTVEIMEKLKKEAMGG